MKYALFVCLALSGCGVGTDPVPEVKTMAVRLDANTVLPNPFVLGPSGTQATPASAPVVTFVPTHVAGPVAVTNPPIVTMLIPTPICTDGFVIGPCVPQYACRPDSSGFVAGPCGN
jgi:hypothetical protein